MVFDFRYVCYCSSCPLRIIHHVGYIGYVPMEYWYIALVSLVAVEEPERMLSATRRCCESYTTASVIAYEGGLAGGRGWGENMSSERRKWSYIG